jgi:hypothetical protein
MNKLRTREELSRYIPITACFSRPARGRPIRPALSCTLPKSCPFCSFPMSLPSHARSRCRSRSHARSCSGGRVWQFDRAPGRRAWAGSDLTSGAARGASEHASGTSGFLKTHKQRGGRARPSVTFEVQKVITQLFASIRHGYVIIITFKPAIPCDSKIL